MGDRNWGAWRSGYTWFGLVVLIGVFWESGVFTGLAILLLVSGAHATRKKLEGR